MRLSALRVVGFTLALLTGSAHAESDIIFQVGKWGPCSRAACTYTCPQIKFHEPFGAVPTVAAALANVIESLAVIPGGITKEGFTPQIPGRFCSGVGLSFGGNWVAYGPPVALMGSASPRYMVLMVAYTPPGTNGGRSASSVVYQDASTAGTTTSVSSTFKQTYSVTADAGAGFIGGGGAGLTFAYSRSVTDDQSLDIKKTRDTRITVPGPSVDGIDHDRDYIYLWLNPQINLALGPSSGVWTFTGEGIAEIQYVRLGWLRTPSCSQDATHPTCMPDNVRNTLRRFGVTEDDFPDIAQYDVFYNGSYVLDQNRFKSLNFTFPYEPPYSANDPVPTTEVTLSNTSTSTVGSKVTENHTVAVELHGDLSFVGLAKASLKNTDTWDWTNASSQSTLIGRVEAATVTIGGPAFGYNGPTDIIVYYDTVFKTFVFVPASGGRITLNGTLLDAEAKPVFGAEISVLANHTKYRTLTNSRGEWRFFGIMNGQCEIQVNGMASRALGDCNARDIQLR
jgi:hypothetical protein